MTTYIRTKVNGDSVIEVNGVEAVVIGSGGITSGIGKNKIINGNFGINQRGVTGTVVLAAGIYGHDRFKAGAGGCTYTFATVNNVTTITISAGSLQQVVEGVNLFSGDVVLSWAGTAQGKIGAGAYGTSGVTGVAVGGTNLTVEFSTGTLSLVQLETGTIKSAFEQRAISVELAMCQRYYEFALLNAFVVVNPLTYAASIFKVSKRTIPTMTFTIESGSGATFVIDATGFYNSGVNSLTSRVAWTAAAEL